MNIVCYVSLLRLVFTKKLEHDHSTNEDEYAAELQTFSIKPEAEKYLTRE